MDHAIEEGGKFLLDFAVVVAKRDDTKPQEIWQKIATHPRMDVNAVGAVRSELTEEKCTTLSHYVYAQRRITTRSCTLLPRETISTVPER